MTQTSRDRSSIREQRERKLYRILKRNWEFNRYYELKFANIQDLRFLRYQPEDWLTINLTEAWDMGLPRWLARTKTQLVELLQEKYPSHQWDKMFTLNGRFGQQRRLERAISVLFPVCISYRCNSFCLSHC